MASFLSKTTSLPPVAASVHRRGYTAASHGLVGFNTVRKVEERLVGIKEDASSSAWAPDPRTGFYRPANKPDEIDPVELRQMLLNQKVRQQ